MTLKFGVKLFFTLLIVVNAIYHIKRYLKDSKNQLDDDDE